MTKNDRKRTIITVFMIQFVREGHFGEQNKDKILTTLIQIKNHYDEFSKVKSEGEYALISQAVARIENELVTSDILTTPAMMMVYLTEVAGKYAELSSGLRKILWQKLYDELTSTEEYQELINRVPGTNEIEQVDTATRIEEVFESAIKHMEAQIDRFGLAHITRVVERSRQESETKTAPPVEVEVV